MGEKLSENFKLSVTVIGLDVKDLGNRYMFTSCRFCSQIYYTKFKRDALIYSSAWADCENSIDDALAECKTGMEKFKEEINNFNF